MKMRLEYRHSFMRKLKASERAAVLLGIFISHRDEALGKARELIHLKKPADLIGVYVASARRSHRNAVLQLASIRAARRVS